MLRMCNITYHVIISEISDPHFAADPDKLYAICDDEESAKALAAKWNEEHSDAWAKAWVKEVIKLIGYKKVIKNEKTPLERLYEIINPDGYFEAEIEEADYEYGKNED